MRDDMFKVIVERPRLVNSNGYSRDGRRYRNNFCNEEDAPSFLGMKRGYRDTKRLNENLAPLQRYLGQQVNRPWNKVYSDIRANIDPRNTVKQHILQHLDNFVAIETRWEGTAHGGQVMVKQSRWFGTYVPLEKCGYELFVHPRTGILLRNRRYASHVTSHAWKRNALEMAQLAVRRDISDRVQLHCLDGIWYQVMLKELPRGREVVCETDGVVRKDVVHDECWDVVRKAWFSRTHRRTTHRKGKCSDDDLYGCRTLYAVAKRQLNSRELQKHQLTESVQKQKGPRGPFCFCTHAFRYVSI